MNRRSLIFGWIASLGAACGLGAVALPKRTQDHATAVVRYRLPAAAVPGKDTELAGKTAGERMRRILQEMKVGHKAELLRLVIAAGPGDMAAIADVIHETPARKGPLQSSLWDECELFFMHWGYHDPAAAMEWVSRHNPESLSGMPYARFVTVGWASRNPKEAIVWLNHPDRASWPLACLRSKAAKGWAERDWKAATEYLFTEGFPDSQGEARDWVDLGSYGFTETVFRSHGLKESIRWLGFLETLPNCEGWNRRRAGEELMTSVENSGDAETAAEFVRMVADDPYFLRWRVEKVLTTACGGDPERMLEASLTAGPEPGSGKYYVIEDSIKKWCRSDLSAVREWVRRHDDSPAGPQLRAALEAANPAAGEAQTDTQE